MMEVMIPPSAERLEYKPRDAATSPFESRSSFGLAYKMAMSKANPLNNAIF